MSAISVDTRDRKPIWEQLTDNVKSLVLCGGLLPGEQLPGVRSLASELAINPNTIQKAYAELERQGIIYSIQGRGSFVSEGIESIRKNEHAALLADLTKTLSSLKNAGISKEDICAITEKVWGGTMNE